MAILSPTRPEIDTLPTKLNRGEQRVLDALERLDDGWRVYVQPSLRMDQPDFVVVHDDFGVCVIEVKDWRYGIYRQGADGFIDVCADGKWQRTREAPRLQVHRYRQTIHGHFFAAPGSSEDFPVVRGAVLLPNYDTDAARRLLHRHHLSDAELHRNVAVWGGDALDRALIRIVTGKLKAPKMRFPSAALRRLEWHLAEPEVVRERRSPLVLSDAARNLEKNPSDARIRRARGPAGSGKSLGLAARAARLAQQGRDVLVLSFNITLPHYLRDLAARHGRALGVSIRRITFTHFHGFCGRLSEDGRAAGVPACRRSANDIDLLSAAEAACAAGVGRRYDAILVDEGQDFKADWWNFLRTRVLAPDGEMLVVGDCAQDLYDRAGWTEETSMLGCGFRGGWTQLKGSYRLPPDLVPVVAAFGSRYLPAQGWDPPAVPADHPLTGDAAEPTIRRWTNLPPQSDLGAAIAKEIREILQEHDLKLADVVFLCETHEHGLAAARAIEAAGEHVTHVFASDEQERRRRKHRFWGGAPGVKGCTVHSFKGWESRGVVLCIQPGVSSRRLAYVALTRVKGDPGSPSVVRVLNQDPGLDAFKNAFERVFTVAEVPALGGQRRIF